MPAIIVVHVYPPLRGTAQYPWRYMAYFEGSELDTAAPRGWGQTAREAEDAIVRNPLQDRHVSYSGPGVI